MPAGKLYHAWNPELVRERVRTRGLLNRYNASEPDDEEGRRAILGALLANIGEGAWVEPPFSCDYGSNISLGDRAHLTSAASCSIALRLRSARSRSSAPASMRTPPHTHSTPCSGRPGSSTRFRS